MTEQRRLAAIVSADVSGYSRQMGRDALMTKKKGPPGWADLLVSDGITSLLS
jgi:hypothetical protein